MTDEAKKKRGPKAKYEHLRPNQDGAPSITTRLDPEALDWVKSQPEGTRPYLERIILADKKSRSTQQDKAPEV